MGEEKLGCFGFIGLVVFIIVIALLRLPIRGEHVGYITAVDRGLFCTKVYVKTDLASSQEDVYSVSNSEDLVEELKEARDQKSNVKLTYRELQLSVCERDMTKLEILK
jgi:hypothetical protein